MTTSELPDSLGRSRVDLFGIPVDGLSMDDTVDAARKMVADGDPHQHVVVNAGKLVEARRDPTLAAVIRGCDLVNADGQAVVWAARILGRPLPERVAGIDLFERLVAAAADDGRSVYFLGARAEVVREVATVFAARHPGLADRRVPRRLLGRRRQLGRTGRELRHPTICSSPFPAHARSSGSTGTSPRSTCPL